MKNKTGTQITMYAKPAFWIGLILLTFSTAQAAPFAYITNLNSNDVTVIDTATNTVVTTIPVGSAPFGVAINAANTRVYVANSNSFDVSVIDTMTNTVIETIFLGGGRNPIGLAINPAGTRVYVTVLGGWVSVIDTTTNTVVASAVINNSAHGLAVNPAGTRVYVADHQQVSVLDTASNTITATVPLGLRVARGIAVNSTGTRVYVTTPGAEGVTDANTVAVIDTASNTILTNIPVGEWPTGVAIHPDDSLLYVTNNFSESLSVIDTATNSVVRTVAMAAPQGVAVNSTGTAVYVANYVEQGTITVLDTFCNSVSNSISVGSYPVALGQFIGYAGPVVPPPSEYIPPLNLEITGIEVTQGVQDLANSVRLVSNRRTFVRVYVKSIGPAVPGVTAILRGSGTYDAPGGSVTVPFTALTPSNTVGPRITVRPDPKRSNLDDSFLFELPWNWTAFAALRLEAVLATDVIPPRFCPNDPVPGPIYQFDTLTTLKVAFVRLGYRTTANASVPLTFAEASVEEQRRSEAGIRLTYPLSILHPAPDFFLFDGGLGSHVDRSHEDCKDLPEDEVNLCAHRFITSRLAALQARTGFMGTADAAYGLIPQITEAPGQNQLFTRGACCSERIGAGPSNQLTYAAHEIGHFLGRQHPVQGAAECGHTAKDENYPYFQSFVGPGILGPVASFTPETDLAGFNGGDASLASPIPMTYYYGQKAYDFMGYCGNYWISDYTYNALYISLLALHPNFGGPGVFSNTSAGGPGPTTPQAGDWLTIFGNISPDMAIANFVETRRVSQIAAIPSSTAGDLSVRLIGAGDTVLADYRFLPKQSKIRPAVTQIQLVLASVLSCHFSSVLSRSRLSIHQPETRSSAPRLSVLTRRRLATLFCREHRIL